MITKLLQDKTPYIVLICLVISIIAYATSFIPIDSKKIKIAAQIIIPSVAGIAMLKNVFKQSYYER